MNGKWRAIGIDNLTGRFILSLLVLALAVPIVISGCSSKDEAPKKPANVVKKVSNKQEQVTGESEMKAPPKEEEFKGYTSARLRDPFLPFLREGSGSLKRRAALTPLEKFDMGELKFVGVIKKGKESIALVEDNEGKGYTVRRGMRMGKNSGIVSKISERELLVVEEYMDIYGKKIRRERKLTLPAAGGM